MATFDDSTLNPDDTMATIFQLPALGRVVCLGELYDQRRGKFLGVRLYPQDKVHETEADIEHTDLSVRLSTTHEEKSSVLGINPLLSLEVLSSLIKVSGSASYLNDVKSNTNEHAFALALKMRLKEKRILFSEREPERNILEDYIEEGLATHFVSAIVYGGNLIVNLIAVESETSKEEKLQGKMEAQLNKLKGSINLEGPISADIKERFKDMDDKFDLVVHGDVSLKKVPINPRDVLDTFPDAASLVTTGGGVPISVTLQPIPKRLVPGGPIYKINDDFLAEVLKAYAMLDDLRSRFSVLQASIKNFQDFVPLLAQTTSEIAATYTKDHDKLLYQLRKFLYDYRFRGKPDPDSIFADVNDDRLIDITGDKMFEEAQKLFEYHVDPSHTNGSNGYPSSLAGLENELSKFRHFVSDVQRVRNTLQTASRPSPVLSTIEDICRAVKLQTTIPLFIMTPLTPNPNSAAGSIPSYPATDSTPTPEQFNHDLAIIRFLAILRRYAAYLRDPTVPAYILYAENPEVLESRLPSHGKFSGLKTPFIFIGQVDVQGNLSWSTTPPTLERALELHHKPLAKQLGNLSYNVDPVDGTQSFSFQIHAIAPDSDSKANQEICIVHRVKDNAPFLRFRTPLKVELERNHVDSAEINSTDIPEPGEPFTATFVQDTKLCKWILYVGDKRVKQISFKSRELLVDSKHLKITYPGDATWWGGEVYKVKAFTYALNQEQIAAEVQKAEEERK